MATPRVMLDLEVLMADLTMDELEAITGTHSTHSVSDVTANWPTIVQETRHREVIVTNANEPEAVILSVERYAELKAAAGANDPLSSLRADFNRELAILRSPDAADTLRDIFAATPEAIALAANTAVLRAEG
jgi:prevent-host-death family protein